MPERRLIYLMLLLLGGCASLGSVNPFSQRSTALDAAAEMVSPNTPKAERKQLMEQIRASYNQDPSPENTLALALVYAVPDQAQSSNAKALALLNRLDTRKLSRQSRLLANWLSSEVAYRDSLLHKSANLGKQLISLKRALAQAKEKIQILTHIEQTIGPSPQLDQTSGGQR